MEMEISTHIMFLAAEDNSGVISHVDTEAVEVILVTEDHCSLHSRGWDLTKGLCTLRGTEKVATDV